MWVCYHTRLRFRHFPPFFPVAAVVVPLFPATVLDIEGGPDLSCVSNEEYDDEPPVRHRLESICFHHITGLSHPGEALMSKCPAT